MTVTEILQLADRLVSTKRGKPLDDLQESIIKGMWEGKTYQEIADECNRSESRVRNVAAKLLQLFSEHLEEKIEKNNFRATFKKLNISLSPLSQNICNIGNKECNFGSQVLYNSSQNDKENKVYKSSKSIYHDLTLAPQIINFYNRETEAETLYQWIFHQKTRLISVLGLLGMGKTTLVKRFIDLNLDQFEVIIWKDLNFPKPLDLLLNDILTLCQQEPKENLDDKLQQLLSIFTEKKCLIILDDVQNLFVKNQLAGQYQSKYQPYQLFFNLIAETSHQSHLLLISQEKCCEMDSLDPELYPIQSLELKGLYNLKLLKNLEIDCEENGLSLIKLYQGNCFYLKSIIQLIQNNYDSKVIDFLTENSRIGILPVNIENNHQDILPMMTTPIQTHLQEIFDKLSTIEQQIVLKLTQFDQPISREDLRQTLTLSSVEFNNGLDSLQKRYLLTKIKEEIVLFSLFPLFKKAINRIKLNKHLQ